MTGWMGGIAGLADGAGAMFAGLVIAVLVACAPRPRRVVIEQGFGQAPSSAAADLPGAHHRAVLAVEQVLNRRGRLAHHATTPPRHHATTLELAGVKMRPGRYVVLIIGVGIGVGALVGLAPGPFVGFLAMLASGLVARLLRKVRTSRRRKAFADQLDDSLQLLASSLRAGHSLLRALDAVSREAEEPTAPEFARVVNQTRLGRDLGFALDDTATRMGSDDFLWVAQAIAIHRTVGGNLAEVLDTVGNTIRERNQIRRQVKALSAEGRLSAYVLMALPFGITGFLAVSNPSYIGAFTRSALGYALIAVALVMLVVGALWLRKVVTFKF